MLDVFLTVDVEIWCNGWDDIDRKFPRAFEQYIYGPTAKGDYGLPYQLRVLRDHGLTGVFFVEPLFAARFGEQPLAEIVGMVNEAGQEVQLHLHTEWVDEARVPMLPDQRAKRQHLRYFSRAEQATLIAQGAGLLERAGAGRVNAFRAGSFAFNRDTLPALATNGIAFDTSYNAAMFGTDSGVMPGLVMLEPFECDGVTEYPMTVFRDGRGSLRHAQLTSCSYAEMESLLWQAAEQRREAFVILSHGFEMLNVAKTKPDLIVVDRFERLCRFFERHRDTFCVRGFHELTASPRQQGAALLRTGLADTLFRSLQQAYRRSYG